MALDKWVLKNYIEYDHRFYEELLYDVGFYTLLLCAKNVNLEIAKFSTYATISLRRNYKRYIARMDRPNNDTVNISPQTPETTATIESMELCTYLLKCLNNKQLVVVQLYFYGGKTIMEIQKILDVSSYQVVQNRLKTALERMKQCYS